jgi:hypothetical protein
VSAEIGRVQTEVAAADAEEAQMRLAARALELRRSGMSWWDIAEALQLSEAAARKNAAAMVAAARSLVGEATKREQLDMEVDRLDALQAHWWDAATRGLNPAAAKIVLETIKMRATLLGLTDVQAVVGQVRIIQGQTENEYVQEARAAAERRMLTQEPA